MNKLRDSLFHKQYCEESHKCIKDLLIAFFLHQNSHCIEFILGQLMERFIVGSESHQKAAHQYCLSDFLTFDIIL